MPVTEQKLLELRRTIDAAHQPTHEETICALLGALGTEHRTPYGLAYSDRRRLMQVAHSMEQPRWPARRFAEPFLYRICSWESLVLGSSWNNALQIANSDATFSGFSPGDRVTRWLPLREHAAGPLRGLGGVTWWTPSTTVQAAAIIDASRENGLPDNWLATRSVVLRCATQRISTSVFVPSTLDAFFSEVFLAAREKDNPQYGSAIGLGPDALRAGAIEIVCGEIGADAIDFCPVQIPGTGEKVVLNDVLRERIADYLREAAKLSDGTGA